MVGRLILGGTLGGVRVGSGVYALGTDTKLSSNLFQVAGDEGGRNRDGFVRIRGIGVGVALNLVTFEISCVSDDAVGCGVVGDEVWCTTEDLSLVKAGIEAGAAVGLPLFGTLLNDLPSTLLCTTLEEGAVVLLMLPVLESETGVLGVPECPLGYFDRCPILSDVCRVSFSL